MLNCDPIRELGADYPDGDLPPGTRLRIRLHLLLCRGCRLYTGQMRTLRRLLGGLPRLTADDPVRIRVRKTFGNSFL